MRRLPLLAMPALLFGACAPMLGRTRDPVYAGNGSGAMSLPPLTVYQDSTGPLSHRVAARSEDGLREVRGDACQSGLMLPVGLVWAAIASGNTAAAPGFLSFGWGDGGYAAAAANALTGAPGARLVNVRADLHTTIILGVWREQCVHLTALVVPVR